MKRAIMIKTMGDQEIANALADTALARENRRLREENAMLKAEVWHQRQRVYDYHAQKLAQYSMKQPGKMERLEHELRRLGVAVRDALNRPGQ